MRLFFTLLMITSCTLISFGQEDLADNMKAEILRSDLQQIKNLLNQSPFDARERLQKEKIRIESELSLLGESTDGNRPSEMYNTTSANSQQEEGLIYLSRSDSTYVEYFQSDESEKTIYDYNDESLVETERYYVLEEGTYELFRRVDYTYDENLYASTSTTTDRNPSGEMVPEYKFVYDRDEFGNLILNLTQYWDEEAEDWVDQYKHVYAYNEAGKQTLYEYSSYDFGLGEMRPRYRNETEYGDQYSKLTYFIWSEESSDWVINDVNEYYYNEAGVNTEWIYSSIRNDELTPVNKRLYEYSDEGLVSSTTAYNYSSGEWVLNFETMNVYTFDEAENITESIQTISYDGASFENSFKSVYAYENGYEVLSEGYTWTGSEWQLRDKIETGYDDDRIASYRSYYYNSSLGKLIGSYGYDNFYDEETGGSLGAAYYTWDVESDEWVGDYRNDYEVDDRGFFISWKYSRWQGGDWTPIYERTYFRSPYFEQIQALPSVEVYSESSIGLTMSDYFEGAIDASYEAMSLKELSSVTIDEQQLTITGAEGTFGLDSIELKIYYNSKDYFVRYFEVNVLELVLGAKLSEVMIYPNPASNEISLNVGSFSKAANVQIISTSGQVYHSSLLTNDRINIQALSRGTYIIKISDGDLIKSYRLLKQ